MNMVVRYYGYFKQYEDLLETFPSVLSVMRVSGDEVLIQYKDAIGDIQLRRLKVDDDHFIKIVMFDC